MMISPGRPTVSGAVVSAAVGLTVMCLSALVTLFFYKIPQSIQDRKARMAVSKAVVDKDVENVTKRLDQSFMSIKGNERAKREIREAILGWLESKKSDNPATGGLVLYLIGPTGIGKTMAAEGIAKSVVGEEAKVTTISLSSIDQASEDSTDTQIFAKKKEPSYGNLKITVDPPVVNQLKHNPRTVVIFNEYDKLQKRDGTLDSRLWDISDNGVIEVEGQRLNCAETIFIVTSNERPSCIGGRDNNQPDEMVTEVEHSFAFKGRVNVIVFENPDIGVYADVLRCGFNNVYNDYRRRYNIDVKISESDIRLIASEIHNMNRGIRGTNQFIRRLYSALVEYRINNNIHKRCRKTVKLTCKYSETEGKFLI